MDRIEVTYWPVGARLVNLILADDPAFSTEDFVRAKALRVELRLLPLFIGQFIPKRMGLSRRSSRWFATRKAGTTSIRAAGKRKIAGGGIAAQEHKRCGKNSRSLWLPALDIADGTLRFRDLTDGSELIATQIHLKTTEIESGDPFEIHLEAAVKAAKPNLQLESQIGSIRDIVTFATYRSPAS